MAQNLEDFVPILCFIPAIPRAHPDGLKFFFHPQSHRILLSVREHTYDFGSLASSSLDLKWGEVGKCQLEKRWDPESTKKTSYHWNLPRKKTQQLRLKRFQRWQCFASACFWMFQGSSGCFTGWWCWEMATASQVKVERFHKLFLWNSLSAVISWKFLATVTCLCA